jgi:hypothetical protein
MPTLKFSDIANSHQSFRVLVMRAIDAQTRMDGVTIRLNLLGGIVDKITPVIQKPLQERIEVLEQTLSTIHASHKEAIGLGFGSERTVHQAELIENVLPTIEPACDKAEEIDEPGLEYWKELAQEKTMEAHEAKQHLETVLNSQPVKNYVLWCQNYKSACYMSLDNAAKFLANNS